MSDDESHYEDYYVPTQAEARGWAARMIAQHQWSWDTIAELAHPEGIVLSQDGCNVMAEALYSCSVTMTWPGGQSITHTEEQR